MRWARRVRGGTSSFKSASASSELLVPKLLYSVPSIQSGPVGESVLLHPYTFTETMCEMMISPSQYDENPESSTSTKCSSIFTVHKYAADLDDELMISSNSAVNNPV